MFGYKCVTFLIPCILLHSVSQRYQLQATVITVDAEMTQNMPSFIVCTTSTNLTGAVAFYTGNDINRGGCLFAGNPLQCSSTTPGYSVTQNVSARTTTLHIDSVDCTRETGNWYCRHGDTDTSSSKYIGCNTIRYAPTITTVPNNKDVVENTQININCGGGSSPGNPLPSYRWTGPDGYSRDKNVLDRTVTRTQGGQYTCTATNTVGSGTATVTINVLYAPVITSVPQNKNVAENTSPNIDCSSNITPGNPSSTSYRWTGPGGYSKTGAVLDIIVTRTQGGKYTCNATNTAGSDTATVNIDVQYLDQPSFTLSKTLVKENDSVTVSCNVTSKPTAQMTIRNVDNNTNIVKQVTNSLQYKIERVQCLHNGTFKCVAHNRQIGQNTESILAPLNVQCSPRHDFRKNFTGLLAREINETARMVADVIANPLPNFTWRKYDRNLLVPISNATIHSVTNKDLQSVLQINVSNSGDYGKYAVQIQNSENTSLLVFQLIGKSPPFTPTDFDGLVDGSRSVTLKWKPSFNGGAKQTFFVEYKSIESAWRNHSEAGIEDPGRDEVTVQITELEPSTKYFFILYSTNIYGASEKITTNITTEKAVGGELNIAAIAGGIVAALLVIIVVAAVVMLYKRGVCGSKEVKSQDKALFKDRHADAETLVMEDNTMYVGLDVNGGATAVGPSATSAGGVFTDVRKKPVKEMSEVKNKQGLEKKPEKKKNKKDDKNALKSKKARGDVYENTVPGQGGTNEGFDSEEKGAKKEMAYGRNEDGLLYVGIDFEGQKPSKEVKGPEDATEYAGIVIGKVGPPLPPDEEEKEK